MSAPAPVLALREARVSFGGRPLFDGLSIGIGARERACLVGRNASGKSTLLKALAGLIELDAGARFAQPGLSVSYLPQEQSFAGDGPAAEFVAGGATAAPPRGDGAGRGRRELAVSGAGGWRWLRFVRSRRYDLIVDLQTNDRSRALMTLLWLSGAAPRHRMGNHRRFPYTIAPDPAGEPLRSWAGEDSVGRQARSKRNRRTCRTHLIE